MEKGDIFEDGGRRLVVDEVISPTRYLSHVMTAAEEAEKKAEAEKAAKKAAAEKAAKKAEAEKAAAEEATNETPKEATETAKKAKAEKA